MLSLCREYLIMIGLDNEPGNAHIQGFEACHHYLINTFKRIDVQNRILYHTYSNDDRTTKDIL